MSDVSLASCGVSEADQRVDGEIERALDDLTAASRVRAAELRAIVTALPEVTSRRSQLRSIVLSVTGAPDMPLRSRQFVLRVLSDQTNRVKRALGGRFPRDRP